MGKIFVCRSNPELTNHLYVELGHWASVTNAKCATLRCWTRKVNNTSTLTVCTDHEDDGHVLDHITMAGNEQRRVGERASAYHNHTLVPVMAPTLPYKTTTTPWVVK